jgi:hypothetical protein
VASGGSPFSPSKRKAFAADQALFNAALQDRLKDAPQEIALAETAMPVLRMAMTNDADHRRACERREH